MSAEFFIDTNVLVYSFDHEATEKRTIASVLIGKALSTGNGVISYQVVQEFLNVSSRKFAVPMKANDQQKYLDTVLMPLCRVFPSIDFYRTGLGICARFGFSFYDSLIVAGALQKKCRTLYSEDLQHQQQIEDLTIINPFL